MSAPSAQGGSGVRTTVIVVTWRGRQHIGQCLDALGAQDRPHRTLVVDNASVDGTAELVSGHPSQPKVLQLTRNTGYAGGLAAALRRVDTPLVAWLNDDAAPLPTWLSALEDAMDANPRAAAAGSVLVSDSGLVQSTGVRLTSDGHGADISSQPAGTGPAETFGFCGGAALLRRAALDAVGGVPAEFFCYYEDTDTAWRLRLAGWEVLSVPAAVVRHRHGASTRPGSDAFHRWNERNRLLMLVRCAPAAVAARQLARFALLTPLLPVRRLIGRAVPDAGNFRLLLRLRVLGGVLGRLPAALKARRRIARHSNLPRTQFWSTWAGHPH